MSYKWLVGSVVVGFVVTFLIIGLIFASTEHEISVSEMEAQDMVNWTLPKVKEFYGVRPVSMQVRFHDTADLLIGLHGHRLGKQFNMIIHVEGQPDIEHSRGGEFYFKADKTKIVSFEWEGKSPTEMMRGAAERYLGKHEGLQNAIIDAAPHIENWMQVVAENGGKFALNHVPLYKLDEEKIKAKNPAWKAVAITTVAAAVKDAKVSGDHLNITYSFWVLTQNVLIFVGLGILVLIISIVGMALV